MWFSSGRSGVAGIALASSRYAPPTSTRPSPGRDEAELLPAGRGCRRVARTQRDVVEVELRVGLRLDEDDLEPLAEVDDRLAAVERGHAQADPLERALLARPLGVEERQLAAARVARRAA